MNGPRLIRRHAAAFGRFAGLGGGVTLASSVVLVLLSQWVPWVAANALTTVASAVVATELHARVSFGHGRPGWTGHLKSAVTVALGWLVTSAAVGSLAALRPGAGLVLQQTVYLSATALVGIGRYLALRMAVFAEPTPRPRPAGPLRGGLMRLGRRADPHRRPGTVAGRSGRPHCRLPTQHPCVPREFPETRPVFVSVS
ncbi:GtrA family protein [Streptomyces mauvecolor]